MFGKFAWEDQTDRGLNFTRRDGGSLVVCSQFGGFSGDTFKDIIDERVHDRHGLVGDTSFGVNLLQDFVDVGGVGFLSGLLLVLLLASGLFLGSLGRGFSCRLFSSRHDFFRWHVNVLNLESIYNSSSHAQNGHPRAP